MDNQNFQDIAGATTVWVGNNPYLASPSGLIPLTSDLSALSLGQHHSSETPQLSNNSQGQYYVVSVQESPTKTSPPAMDNPRAGLGVYSGNFTTSTPNLGFDAGNNNSNHLQFTPQPVSLQYSPNLMNGLQGQQIPPTFTNGFSTLQYLQKSPNTLIAQHYSPSLLNIIPNQQYVVTGNHQLYSNTSLNGNPEHVPLVSPSLSSSSISMQSESSYGALPSPDTSLNCVYSTNTITNDSTPLALSGPATLPKPKRSSVGEVFQQNGTDQNKTTYHTVPPCYDRPINKECCLRCGKKVYHMEKLGPVKDCLYHKLCFSCIVCNSILNVKNYHLNPNDMDDLNVYCVTHMPINRAVSVDAKAVGIKGALMAPKLNIVNEQIRGGPDANNGNKIDNESLGIKTAIDIQRKTSQANENVRYKGHTYNLDAESLSIQHVLNIPVQNLQASNKMRESSWTRNERNYEAVPPIDVIRYDAKVPEYDHMTTSFHYSP